jgi:hypothetical protein
VGPAAIRNTWSRRCPDGRRAAVAQLGPTRGAFGHRRLGGWGAVAGLGCAGRPAPSSSGCASERATQRAPGAGADLGSTGSRRGGCTDISRRSDLGRGSAAAAPGARAGSVVGRVGASRAPGAHLGLTCARAFLGATASHAILGRAQACGLTRTGAIVGRAAFGAT